MTFRRFIIVFMLSASATTNSLHDLPGERFNSVPLQTLLAMAHLLAAMVKLFTPDTLIRYLFSI